MATTAPLPSLSAVAPDLAGHLERFAPGVAGAMAEFHAAAWQAVDAELLALCRLRLTMLLGDPSEFARQPAGAATIAQERVDNLARWPDAPCYTETERVCLAFTEQFVGDVANLTDEDAAAALAALGPAAFFGFVNALLVFDGHQRLRLATKAIFGAEEEA